jgi:hypothetical protein
MKNTHKNFALSAILAGVIVGAPFVATHYISQQPIKKG